MTRWGVLLMAYGSPSSLEDVEDYYTHIRGGRAPSADLVRELRARYERIGGTSPLLAITRRQGEGLERALAQSGLATRVHVGMKHSPPFIADVMASMAQDGIRAALGLALAPHYSRVSVASYFTTAAEVARRHGISLETIETWHDHPGFIAALVARVRQAQQRFAAPQDVPVVFTAHSLPQRITQWNDPYPQQFHRTCELVAEAVGLSGWTFAYQSASHTTEPWLGPDLLEALQEVARRGHGQVIVSPVGFVADHLEVLYDIDVEARELAARLGMHLERAPSLNDGPDFVRALAELVRAHVPEGIAR